MGSDGVWLPAPPELSLRDGEVHVWRLALDEDTSRRFQAATLLSDSERERAGRFHFQVDRDRYATSRSVLRILLGRYLGRRPQDVEFGYTEHGKPFLPDTRGSSPVRFNVSHSGNYTLYAFAYDREVGIDVEQIRPLQEFESIATQVFTGAEQQLIARAPHDEKAAAFFRLWSRKEAYVKAIGHGLSAPLHEISVVTNRVETPDGHGPARERFVWCVQDLNCAPSYAAALVTQGEANRTACWQL